MATSQQFVSDVYSVAREMGLNHVQASLAASQAALESRFGRSAPGNNIFGIKAGRSWRGRTQNLKTKEQGAKGLYSTRSRFRAYDSIRDSLRDWANLVSRRWPSAWHASTFPAAVEGLKAGKRGGYATDRRYNQKLGQINDRYVRDAVASALQREELADLERAPVPAPRGVEQARYAPMAPPESPLAVSRGTMGGIEGQLAPAPEYLGQSATPQRMAGTFGAAPAGMPQISPALSDTGLTAAYQGLGQSLAQAGVRDLAGTPIGGGPPLMPAAPAPPVLDVDMVPLDPVEQQPPAPPLAPPAQIDTLRTVSVPPAPVPMRADPVVRAVQQPQLGLMGRIATSPLLGGTIGNAMKEQYYPPAPALSPNSYPPAPMAPTTQYNPLAFAGLPQGQEIADISPQASNALSGGWFGLF